MAENILGLLLVTSSSRGRNVFRYPPDPFSPHARLSQPYYPQSTYTVKDTIIEKDRRQLFPPEFELRPKKSSNQSISVKSDPYRGLSDGHRERKRVREWIHEGSTIVGEPEEEESSDDSSVSSDSEVDNMKQAMNVPIPKRSIDLTDPTRISLSHPAGASLTNAKLSIDNTGSVRYDGSRRSSLAPGDLAKEKDKKREKRSPEDEYYERQYDSALAYSLDFLGDMLTPPRSACNRKFEINVDEIIFVGHPVTCGQDGKWAFPEEDDDLRPSARGRRRARDAKDEMGKKDDTGKEKSALVTVIEGQVVKSIDMEQNDSPTKSNRDEADGPPSLNMFHLVVILDKPDPKGNGLDNENNSNSWADEVYREIAFKWTAAAFALQVKEDWVAKNTWDLVRAKEKCFAEGASLLELCRVAYETSSLDRSLTQLFHQLHQLRTRPANPLHSYLPTTITLNVADLPISMVLSPRSSKNDEAWAHWGERDDQSSVDESDSEDAYGGVKSMDLHIAPWQTLLLLEDDAASKAQEISRALVGLGMGNMGLEEEYEDNEPTPMVGSRRDSKDTHTAEEDEGLLMKNLIESCDVTKRLYEIAHVLRYDLEGIVIPLARELVANKKAILIDVVNTRLRTVVMPTTIAEHTSTLDEYAGRFAQLFPRLPPLACLLAQLSSIPAQFKEILPRDAPQSMALRQIYMDALIWLLKQDLVVQVHTRCRVFARPEIKEKAWRKLWHRRRERWLQRLNREAQTPHVSPMDLTTPRAEKRVDPLDASVPVPRSPFRASLTNPEGVMSDQEADSDVNEDAEEGSAERYDMGFSMDEPEPQQVPAFQGSFIFRPARAQKDETRWLRAIRESAPDEVWASKFDLCVQYFDGVATFEEISFRTGMSRKEIERVLSLYPDDLVTFLHP